ncbi:cyanate transporter [Marinobacterium rhizophilum]|uniref:Cyanate transporter n=1 Tax=Marinobacterium rhizophilum TaxID=420402 RepID=A0ABY5HDL7_9GAMM|nr:cyanate transporter [Marinobacterium rhizophilum]UTW10440.1 cyanate transporter [Marinobacterium rhizophilum]
MNRPAQPRTAELAVAPSPSSCAAPVAGLGGFMLLVLVGLNLRPFLTSVGPVLKAVQADTGMGHGLAAILTTLPFIMMGLLALAGAGLARRFGEQRTLLGALLLLALGCGARLLADSAAGLLLTAVLAGTGVATVQALMPGVCKRWFAGRIALAMGLYSAALVGGGAMGALLSPAMAHLYTDWRPGLAFWALPALLAWGLWLWRAPREQDTAVVALSLRGFFGNRRAWLLALYFGLANSGYASLVAWLPSFYVDEGMDPQSAGSLLAWMALFQAAAALLMPLSVRGSLDRRAGLYGVMLLQLLGFAGFALLPQAAPWLWVALAGFGLGGCFSLCLIVSLDHLPGARAAGALAAFVQGIGFLITAAGPWLVGALRDGGGDFVDAWWLHGAIALCMLLLSVRFNPAGYGRSMARLGA